MTIYQVILCSITVITIICQSYLFYLIRYKSPKAMKGYSFYLNYYTGYDLIFTIIMGIFWQPDPTGVSMSIQVCGVSSWIGPRAEIFTSSIVFYACFNTFIGQIYCFLYRYASLHNRKMCDMFGTNRMKLILFIVSQLFSMLVFFFFYKIIVPPGEFFDKNTQNQVLLELREYVQQGKFVISFLSPETTWVPNSFLVFALTFFLCSEIFSVYVIYAILATLKKNTTNFSKNTYRLHHQLTVLLAVQLVIPLVLIVIPVSIRWITYLATGNELVTFNNFRMTLITLYGITNTLFAIIFIAPYRRHTYNTFIFPILSPWIERRSHHQDSMKTSS